MKTKNFYLMLALATFAGFTSCSKDDDEDDNPINEVSYSDSTGYINGHGYVDLGLPSGVKWATRNVGASASYDYGDYYAWGEVTTKSEYTAENSETYHQVIAAYDDISGNLLYDVARVLWSGSWRLPTMTEVEELAKSCTWTWGTIRGYNGYQVTGPNGNSIFLPAAGSRGKSLLIGVGDRGCYWSSSCFENDTELACGFIFENNFHSPGWTDRYFGHSIRPVSN